MAAKLKKRALAEFSHVVTEEPASAIKSLRLWNSARVPAVTVNFSSTSTSEDVIFLLLKLEQNLPGTKEGADNVVGELADILNTHKDTIVRCKIFSLFSLLAKVPGCNVQRLGDDLLLRSLSEKSQKVLAQMFNTMRSIAYFLPPSSSYVQKFVIAAKKSMSSQSHSVRSSCLHLIGSLGFRDSQNRKDESSASDNLTSVQAFLTNYIMDPDPRVRCSAFEAMLSLHNSGHPLSLSAYKDACSALSDDYEGVRLAATQLIWVLCHLYPEDMVKVPNSSEDIRLVDDGFAKICGMVVDVSLQVRVRSSQLLGSLHMVSPRFLEQTLDKKLMSKLRRKNSAHERAREHFWSGEWSSGQRWADDAPKEEVNPDAVSLLNIGACGAFVHGLEDEYLEVRNATLDSLCELASNSHSFAQLSVDSIIDMFNDEIESVRLNAIHSLRKVCPSLLFRDDQMDIILGVLQDFSFTTRHALREMLCHVRMATRTCLNACAMGLLDNLRRYPQDKASVWRCCQQLGTNHPAHTLALMPDLLCLHPFFDTPEPDMDDPAYISILLLVFSAASLSQAAVPLFPEHARRHYLYLRSSLPHLVPSIKTLDSRSKDSNPSPNDLETETVANTEAFLEELSRRLVGIETMDPSHSVSLLESAVRDFTCLKQLDSRVAASAECTCLYLKCQLLMTKFLLSITDQSLCLPDPESSASTVDKIVDSITLLKTGFLGQSSEMLWILKELELKVWAIHVFVLLTSRGSLGEKIKSCEVLKSLVSTLKKSRNYHLAHDASSLEGHENIVADPVTQHLVSNISQIDSSHLHNMHTALQNALPLMRPRMTLCQGVKQVKVILTEPVENQEASACMDMSDRVRVVATIENSPSVEDIYVQIRLPDQTKQWVLPPVSAWTRINSLSHRLDTEVAMAHGMWSEPCNVELTVAKWVSEDAKPLIRIVKLVDLIKPVKLLMSSKPTKR